MNSKQLKELLSTGAGQDINTTINKLQSNRLQPDLKTYKKQFEVTGHDSVDKTIRPDKPIKNGAGETTRMERVNRLGVAMQELITERAVSFLFGSPVKIVCEPQSEKEKQVLAALNRILKDNKIDSFNAEIALEMFKSTEVAECWFPVKKDEKHNDYGFPTEFKLRVMAFNPWDGNELYPLFDETGDMIAFSRAFVVTDDANKQIKYFETYTADEKIVWKQDGGTWTEESRVPNVIGKIPVVFGKQKTVEWANVQVMIDRLEWLLSNYADTNDYHGSPTIFVKGEIAGWAQKGESGKIIQGAKDATAEYLSWNQAPEMVKLEIETLFRLIFSISQTPDISFEAVKGLGEISGVALKMLFLDAHLKVKKKQRVFDAYLERRTNIIKAYIAYMNTGLRPEANAINIEAQIQPFIIEDEKGTIDRLTSATAGKALISQKTAIKLSGLVDNVDEEYKLIKEETQRERSFDVLEPTI